MKLGWTKINSWFCPERFHDFFRKSVKITIWEIELFFNNYTNCISRIWPHIILNSSKTLKANISSTYPSYFHFVFIKNKILGAIKFRGLNMRQQGVWVLLFPSTITIRNVTPTFVRKLKFFHKNIMFELFYQIFTVVKMVCLIDYCHSSCLIFVLIGRARDVFLNVRNVRKQTFPDIYARQNKNN